MTARGSRGRLPNQATLDHAIVAIIANTRRVRRKLDLLTIAEYVETARLGLGSLRAVSDVVGVSEQQLREFLSARKLSLPAQRLIRERKVDSVDVVRELAKLPASDHLSVARQVANGTLGSKDLRAVIALRRSAPATGVDHAVRRVLDSRNIKEYVAEFRLARSADADRVRQRFERLLGGSNVRSFVVRDGVAHLALNAAGMRRLQAAARQMKVTKSEVVESTARGGGRRVSG